MRNNSIQSSKRTTVNWINHLGIVLLNHVNQNTYRATLRFCWFRHDVCQLSIKPTACTVLVKFQWTEHPTLSTFFSYFYTREVSLPCCTSFVARFSTFLFLRGLMGSHISAWFRHHLLSLHKRSKLLNLLASPNISMQCPAYRTRSMILLEAFLLQHVADPDLINHLCYQWRIMFAPD